MKYSIIIATYNRAQELFPTLASIAQLEVSESWEVIIVDNNSSDNTRELVSEMGSRFPTELRYVFESEQGRSAALNAGIKAARGDVIAITDDDVRVDPRWLKNAGNALGQLNCDYITGKALPIWGGIRPDWLPNHGGRHWGVIALLDYGSEPLELREGLPALGVNMCFRREALERVGDWDNRVGRKAGTLLGQEVREWCQRAKAAGLVGYYSPDVVVHHVIPADRLTKRYFRRWFYWNGISRAILYADKGLDMESPERTSLDFSKVPHVAGVPRYLFRTCLKSLLSTFTREPVQRFESELWVWFFAGILRQRWKDRRKPVPKLSETATAERAAV